MFVFGCLTDPRAIVVLLCPYVSKSIGILSLSSCTLCQSYRTPPLLSKYLRKYVIKKPNQIAPLQKVILSILWLQAQPNILNLIAWSYHGCRNMLDFVWLFDNGLWGPCQSCISPPLHCQTKQSWSLIEISKPVEASDVELKWLFLLKTPACEFDLDIRHPLPV